MLNCGDKKLRIEELVKKTDPSDEVQGQSSQRYSHPRAYNFRPKPGAKLHQGSQNRIPRGHPLQVPPHNLRFGCPDDDSMLKF